MNELKKTITVTVPVDPRIADLVYFVKQLRNREKAIKDFKLMEADDNQLIQAAEDFWDHYHGEDD